LAATFLAAVFFFAVEPAVAAFEAVFLAAAVFFAAVFAVFLGVYLYVSGNSQRSVLTVI